MEKIKELAVEKYPKLHTAFLEGEYIDGSERYDDFVLRMETICGNLYLLPTDFDNRPWHK